MKHKYSIVNRVEDKAKSRCVQQQHVQVDRLSDVLSFSFSIIYVRPSFLVTPARTCGSANALLSSSQKRSAPTLLGSKISWGDNAPHRCFLLSPSSGVTSPVGFCVAGSDVFVVGVVVGGVVPLSCLFGKTPSTQYVLASEGGTTRDRCCCSGASTYHRLFRSTPGCPWGRPSWSRRPTASRRGRPHRARR